MDICETNDIHQAKDKPRGQNSETEEAPKNERQIIEEKKETY